MLSNVAFSTQNTSTSAPDADNVPAAVQFWLPRGLRAAGIRPSWPRRQLIDGIRFPVRTGVPWPDSPVACMPWGRIYGLFRRWQRDDTWHRILILPVVPGAPG
ncbi:transposase [Streptomyces rochei]